MKRLYGLDIFRFVTAIFILGYHYYFIGPIQGFYSMKVFHPMFFFGEFGVDIFFIISGFVILFSTERNKSTLSFCKRRLLRIYPTFIICMLITFWCGTLMAGNTIHSLTVKSLNSLTFMSDIWGGDILSSIYWTLMIEVKFYILVAIILRTRLWEKHRNKIMGLWLIVSVVNNFAINNKYITMLLLTKYAGHFILGIILYYLYKGIKEKAFVPLAIASIWLIYENMVGFTSWIRAIYPELIYSNVTIFIFLLLIIGLLYYFTNNTKEYKHTKLITMLGGLSFTLFLLHADFGFFLRTQYYLRYASYIKLDEHIIMLLEIFISLLLAYIVLKISNFITKYLKKAFIRN